MSRPQFETVVAQAPRKALAVSSQNKATALASGNSETVYVYAPSGYIATLKNLYLNMPKPTGAASGSHSVYVGYTGGAGDLMYGSSGYATDLSFDYQGWYIADNQKIPSDVNVVAKLLQSITFDSTIGLVFTYSNASNVSQNNTRNYSVSYVKEQIAVGQG